MSSPAGSAMTGVRHEFAAGVIGGSATVIDYGQTRLVSDPVFSPPGRQGGLTKLTSPALPAQQLGDVDAVLLSHDDHFDNFDQAARDWVASAGMTVITGPAIGIARAFPDIDVAVLHVGAARVATKLRDRPVSLTAERASDVTLLFGVSTVVPAHYEGWDIYTQGLNELRHAFDDAGAAGLLALAPLGTWTLTAVPATKPGPAAKAGPATKPEVSS